MIEEGKLKLKNPIDRTVTYHDPCHLGRCSERYEEWTGTIQEPIKLVKIEIPPKPRRKGTHGVYDPPREVIKQVPGITFKEMERIICNLHLFLFVSHFHDMV